MTVKGFIRNLPLYNPECQAYHKYWKDTDQNLGEVRDLAVRFKKSDEDIAALDKYRSTMNESARRMKQADVQQTIVEPIFLIGGLCGFVGTLIAGVNGFFPSMAAGLGTLAGTMALSVIGGALYFGAQRKRIANDPNRALNRLPYDVHARVGGLLAQKDAMKEVGALATTLKPAATTTVAQTDTTVVLGGVIVRKRRDGSAVAEGVNAPAHPNPRMF